MRLERLTPAPEATSTPHAPPTHHSLKPLYAHPLPLHPASPTQVPQYLLEDAVARGCGGACHVVVTQPRRIAAISVAERVAEERGEPPPGSPGPASTTGYHVRLGAAVTRHTRLTFCTTGGGPGEGESGEDAGLRLACWQGTYVSLRCLELRLSRQNSKVAWSNSDSLSVFCVAWGVQCVAGSRRRCRRLLCSSSRACPWPHQSSPPCAPPPPGILLRRLAGDPSLRGITHVVVDEVRCGRTAPGAARLKTSHAAPPVANVRSARRCLWLPELLPSL